MYLKLLDTQLFLSRTGCHSHPCKPRAINKEGFDLAISATLGKNTVSNYNNYQASKVQIFAFTYPSYQKKNPQTKMKTKNK